MIFARYTGASSEGLTVGKVYLAQPEVNGAELVGFESLEIIDDSGGRLRVNPNDEQFEYLDEVYAVIVKPLEDLDIGDVVILDGATEDGQMYHLKGTGYCKASYFVILDRTNVFPGLNVLDNLSGRWVKVRRVDECLWVVVSDKDETRSLSEFSFAVAEGDILTEPIVRCISADGEPALTEGNLYILRGRNADGLLIVEDDDGDETAFMASRFTINS
jgi:hypothetical protein